MSAVQNDNSTLVVCTENGVNKGVVFLKQINGQDGSENNISNF